MKTNNSNLEMRKIPSLKFLYEINSNGTICRNVKSKKQLKIKLDMHHSNTGYYVTFVHFGGRKNPVIKRVMIHRAVAECWLGPCPDGYEVDHIDRNSRNNDYRNLRYVTKSQQMKNRDHTNIAAIGKKNLEKARMLRSKPVRIYNETEDKRFVSYADCARYLESIGKGSYEAVRYRLKAHRKFMYGYNVEYLRIAETRHDDPTG